MAYRLGDTVNILKLAKIIVATIVLVAVGGAALSWHQRDARPTGPRLVRVLQLDADEGVFAYSRISPDGRLLAYASERRTSAAARPTRTIRVIDLANGALLFAERGIDAYWSPGGERLIFLSEDPPDRSTVSIRDMRTGVVTRDVAPTDLGDYYSWATIDDRDLIVTILSRYYFLDRNRAILPAAGVVPCPGIGVGSRPLVSKDGRRLSTFVNGWIVVRNLQNCEDIVETGVAGAKADFSWDGRYLAFHAPKPDGGGYEIQVVDIARRTLRRVTNLPGSSFFPSWTADGRLSFRYDGADYHGFMLASDVLVAAESPLPAARAAVARLRWYDLFAAPLPSPGVILVIVWATWSAHSVDALGAAERYAALAPDVPVVTAVDVASRAADVGRMRAEWGVRLPQVATRPSPLWRSGTAAQMPMALVFADGVLVDSRLGAQTDGELALLVQRAHRTRLAHDAIVASSSTRRRDSTRQTLASMASMP